MVFFVTIMYNAVKGVKFLKRILSSYSFILFLLILSPTTFAQEATTYTYNDSLRITLPTDWLVHQSPTLLSGEYPRTAPTTLLLLGEDRYETVDDYMLKSEKRNLDRLSQLATSVQLIDRKNLTIDNHKAAYLLYSLYYPGNEKRYVIFYYIFSTQGCYSIYIFGDFISLDDDRIRFEPIVSSLKVLK